jgi:hypothetical protein
MSSAIERIDDVFRGEPLGDNSPGQGRKTRAGYQDSRGPVGILASAQNVESEFVDLHKGLDQIHPGSYATS